MGAVLGVLLAILKWIGIILLCILGLILFLILLVVILLCIPIRIRAKGTAGKDVDKIRVEGDVTYLLKLVHARIFFAEKSLAWQLAVFGKRIAGSEGAGKKDSEEKTEGSPGGAVSGEDASPGENAGEGNPPEEGTSASEGCSGPEELGPSGTEDKPMTVEVFHKKKNPYRPGWVDELEEMQAADRAREEAEAFGEREEIKVTGQAEQGASLPAEDTSGEGFTEVTSEIKTTGEADNSGTGTQEEPKPTEPEVSEKPADASSDAEKSSGGDESGAETDDGIPDWAKDVMTPIGPGKIEELEEKIGGILAKVDYYKMLLDAYPERPEIIRALKRLIRRLLHQFHFRDSHLALRYGFEDPSLAGFLTAGAAIASHIIPSREFQIDFLPQFEEELVIEGDFDIKLRIILQAFIHYVLCFLLYPPTIRLILFVIRELKKGKKEKGTKQNKQKGEAKKGKPKKKKEEETPAAGTENAGKETSGRSKTKKSKHKNTDQEAKEPNHES